jgi:ribosomal protein L11 methyltransferase
MNTPPDPPWENEIPDPGQFWHRLTFRISESQLSQAEDVLYALGAVTVSLQDAGDQPLLEPAPGELPTWDQIVVSVLFEQQQNPETLLTEIQQQLQNTTTDGFTFDRLENRHWERAWLDDFKPMSFGDRLWIYPSHITLPQDNSVQIILDPGLAFGTGTHPTTALCLQWLDQHEIQNKTVIDYGCGSGVLAIAALKLGATGALGIDRDPQALIASRWNAEQNGVAENLQLFDTTNPPVFEADIVLANILGAILIELRETLSSLVKPGGRLVMSGILENQAAEVQAAYSSSFEFREIRQWEDWVLLEAVAAC